LKTWQVFRNKPPIVNEAPTYSNGAPFSKPGFRKCGGQTGHVFGSNRKSPYSSTGEFPESSVSSFYDIL
jgi:hypothetical protein